MGRSLTSFPREVLAACSYLIFIAYLNEEITRIYAAQMVSALEFLQFHNVMHRDLKPHNILLDENLNIKIVNPVILIPLD